MTLPKRYDGYRSFSYLEAGVDYQPFDLAAEVDRVPPWLLDLEPDQVARVDELTARLPMISLHEHLGLFPEDIARTPEYVRHGRMATAFEGLSRARWDCVFDNLMDGICRIR